MTTTFRRRVGAAADLKELEFISALHQSCVPGLREDGTVSSKDVLLLLKSRASLNVPPTHGLRIVRGLGGGRVSEDVIQMLLEDDEKESEQGTSTDHADKTSETRPEKRNFMDRMRLAASIGAVRKRLLQRQLEKGSNPEEEDDEAGVEEAQAKEDLIVEVEMAHGIGGGLAGGPQNDSEDSSKQQSLDDNKSNNSMSVSLSIACDQQSEETRGLEVELSPESNPSKSFTSDSVSLAPSKRKDRDSIASPPKPISSGDVESPPAVASAQSISTRARSAKKSKKHHDEEYLDLVQLMAIILMPTLARAGKEWHDACNPSPEAQPAPPPEYQGLKGMVSKLYDKWATKERRRMQEVAESLRPQPENIIADVLRTMLNPLHGSAAPILNAELVRSLLILHGECERAADAVLVDKMVEMATCASGRLDEEAFVKALTDDLSAWTVGAEDRDTTSTYDVWGYSNYHEKALMEVMMAQEHQEKEEAKPESRVAPDATRPNDDEPVDEKVQAHATTFQEDKGPVSVTGDAIGDLAKDAEANAANLATQLEADGEQLANDAAKSGGATSFTSQVGAGGVKLAMDAGTNAANLATQVGTEGVTIAKQAGKGGAKIVKGAETGGAIEWKAEKKQWKDIPIVRFVDRLVPFTGKSHGKPDDKESHPLEDEQHVNAMKESNLSEPTAPPNESRDDEQQYTMDRTRTAMAIDSAVDVFSSTLLYVGIFVFFICTSLVYASLFQQLPIFTPKCDADSFGCLLLDKIILWAIFAVFLSLTGYLVIIPLSTGNNPAERSPFLNIAAFVVALVLTWIPYAAVEVYKKRRVAEPYDEETEQTVSSDDYSGAQYVTNVVGCIVAGLIFVEFVLAVIGNHRIRQSLLMKKFLLSSLASECGRTKRAATRKINKLLRNASSLKPRNVAAKEISGLEVSEELMINFVIRGEAYEDCGGIIWTWKQLYSGGLFEQEGVWIMSRLRVIQTIQALFIGFKTYALTLFIEEAIHRCEEWQDNLRTDLPQWVYDFVPTPRQARIALWPAFSVAVIIMFTIFFVYLPSYVRRVIEFRCGVLPSLGSEIFLQYRKSMDLVYTNIGNALYAMFGSALLFFFFVALFIFLFIWPFSQDFMLTLLAWSLGLGITIGIKLAIETVWRYCYYAGFYRTKPMKANLTQLALECYYIGLGGGVLLARFGQFILAACFFVGRTDVPFLSADVAMFGYIFDYAPQSFVKDLLVHEAHRHPYIERLFAMYMMKLKDNSFGSEAGSCWRQLFVVSLMPWLVRHRIFSDERLGAYRDEYNTRRREGQSRLQINQHATIFGPRQSGMRASQQDQVLLDASKAFSDDTSNQDRGSSPLEEVFRPDESARYLSLN